MAKEDSGLLFKNELFALLVSIHVAALLSERFVPNLLYPKNAAVIRVLFSDFLRGAGFSTRCASSLLHACFVFVILMLISKVVNKLSQ